MKTPPRPLRVLVLVAIWLSGCAGATPTWVYRRPWEEAAAPLQTLSLTVNVG